MNNLKRLIEGLGVGYRILSGVALAVITATGGAIITVHYLADHNRVQELRHSMSGLLAQSQVMIKNMDAMHRASAFDQSHLTKLARTQAGGRPLAQVYEQTDLYRTIPVVASWQAVAEAAQKEGYEFLTPAQPGVTARNPKNAFKPEFAEMFKAFEAGQSEYFAEDKKTGELVLARPVFLSKSCLSCHGDPATSLSKDGKDVLGIPMEGAKQGDLRGAFVLKAQMKGDSVVRATVTTMAVVGGIILVAVLVAFHLMNQYFLVKPLNAVISQLDAGANQTRMAIQQIAVSSQSLADRTSEQAASIEETSASLEEITSMARRNAENAASGTSLGRATRDAAAAGHQRLAEMSRTFNAIKTAVGEMQAAVGEMQSSSQEISKIIKTIDEIAFQTNLLALNAAVEAARAGSAGAGFGVVADEVRSLAQRSAQAARDTADKIEAAVKRSELGDATSKKVVESLGEVDATARSIEQVFDGIVAQVKSLDELITQIALASKEQNQGVGEVNAAVSHMDKVTQANAASAEENASASEELNAQAKSLQDVVGQLQWLVSGIAGSKANNGRPATASTASTGPELPVMMNRGGGMDRSNPAPTHAVPPAVKHRTDLVGSHTGSLHDF